MPDIMKMGKNPNFLGSWDLDELKNREVTLTINNIIDENVVTSGKTELCTVCYWKENEYKPMILNVTNKKTLCKLYGTKDTEKLKGKNVIIGISKVKAFGDIFDALRIKNKRPALAKNTVYKCVDCGREITDFNKFSAAQIAMITQKRYGVALCSECSTKRKNAESEDKPDETDNG